MWQVTHLLVATGQAFPGRSVVGLAPSLHVTLQATRIIRLRFLHQRLVRIVARQCR